MIKSVVVAAGFIVAGCGGRSSTGLGDRDVAAPLSCGAGTYQLGNVCLGSAGDGPLDAGSGARIGSGAGDGVGSASDAGGIAIDAAPDGASSFHGGDAGPTSGFAVDPAHDNAQPGEAVRSPLTPAWTAHFAGRASYPVVVGDHVVVATAESQPNVRALDLATGAPVWGPVTFGEPVTIASEGSRVFALDTSGRLVALEATDGTQLWATQLLGQVDFPSPPVASGGLVYVNGLGSGGTTYAIDSRTGATVWTARTSDGSEGAIAVAGGVVYEAEACDQVSAFDAASGALLWNYATSCTNGGGAAPAVYDGQIWVRDWALGDVILDTSGHLTGAFVSSVVPSIHGRTAFYLSQNVLTAVSIDTQAAQWSFTGDGELCTSAVVAGANGQVFVGSSSGNLYELDEATGELRSVSLAGDDVNCGSETESMGLASGHLLVPAGNTLVAY